EKEEAAERQQVGIDDPRERGLREAKILPDRRKRDVHDRRVEDDHQIPEAEDVEREPARAAIQGHVGIPFGVSWSLMVVRRPRDAELIVVRPMSFPRSSGPSQDGCLSAPNSGINLSVSRKNVNSTMRPSEISST